jgi:F-type H+-transporting ATPase subunit b
MQLDWTTFGLEILNFLVLVWLLKRFLYRPVLNAIAQRQSRIESGLAESEQKRIEAQALREQYVHRLAEWEHEREQMRVHTLQEVNAERTRLLEGLQASLQAERDKARTLEARHVAELTRQAEEAAITQAAQFAAKLFSRLAGPELETRLVDMVLKDLQDLPGAQRQALRAASTKAEVPVNIVSAYPMSQTQREALAQMLQSVAGRSLHCTWSEDRELIAGLRVSMGPWILRANLQDELKFFAEATRD